MTFRNFEVKFSLKYASCRPQVGPMLVPWTLLSETVKEALPSFCWIIEWSTSVFDVSLTFPLLSKLLISHGKEAVIDKLGVEAVRWKKRTF